MPNYPRNMTPEQASIKKRLCNPPAEMVAANGDPYVVGLFSGAGDALDNITKPETLVWFVESVMEVEEYYLRQRAEIAVNCTRRMEAIFDQLLKREGGNSEYGGRNEDNENGVRDKRGEGGEVTAATAEIG